MSREAERIAAIWASLSDEEKMAELRNPIGTLPSSGKSNVASTDEFVERVGLEVVKLRRLARGFSEARERATLVTDWITGFRSRAARAGWPIKVVDTVAAVVRSETVDWSGWGEKTLYPADAEETTPKGKTTARRAAKSREITGEKR